MKAARPGDCDFTCAPASNPSPLVSYSSELEKES